MNEKVQAPSKNSLAPSPPQLKNTSQFDRTHFTEQTQATHSSGLIQPSFTDRRNIQLPAKSGSGFSFEFTKLPLYSSFGATTNTQLGKIQRQEIDDQKDEEEKAGLQMKSDGVVQTKCSQCEQQEKQQQNSKSTQAKLTVGEPGDKYEQEADRVAQQVMRMSAPESNQLIQPEALTEEEEKEDKVQAKSLAASITPLVQREVAIEGNSQISDNLESKLRGSKGGGSPLSEEVRQFMEPRFNADFSHVRMHTDDKSAKMNQELNAQAFTHENNIFFGAGRYNPSSNEGKSLIAHELTHVVQQTGVVKRKVQKSAIPILNGVAPKSQVLSHLQTLKKSSSSEAALYRKEILQFQRENSGEKIAALQRQVLEEPKSADVQQRDGARSLRRKGDTPATPNTPAPASGVTPPTAPPRRCSVTSGPTYTPSGTIPVTNAGGRKSATFDFAASFDTSSGVLPSCCEVRQFIKWDNAFHTWNGGPPHSGFPSSTTAGTWIEDRDTADKRYGHRSGTHSDPIASCGDEYKTGSTRDQANGNTYCGNDSPDGPTALTGQYQFQLKVIDTCNSDNVKASSSVITINW